MGKYYGLPTHTYAALSDAKIVDAQAGLETAMSGIIAQLAGINVISGAGALDFVSCISLEKLVVDNEICGMALRLHRGMDCSAQSLAADLVRELGPGGDYLTCEHTMHWFKKEPYIPGPVIDRRDRRNWEAGGGLDTFQRARARVEEILENHRPLALDREREEALDRVTKGIMAELKIGALPFGPQ